MPAGREVDMPALRDRLGQSLAALRVDATWLQRRGAGDEQAYAVLLGMLTTIQELQNVVGCLPDRHDPGNPPAG